VGFYKNLGQSELQCSSCGTLFWVFLIGPHCVAIKCFAAHRFKMGFSVSDGILKSHLAGVGLTLIILHASKNLIGSFLTHHGSVC
jgi:hypothetical protein